MAFKTEFEFTLPKGYVDEKGNLHRKGVMRLATAKDEIIPLQDFRVKNNRAYLVIILLSRVITRLEPGLPRVFIFQRPQLSVGTGSRMSLRFTEGPSSTTWGFSL